MNQFRQTDGQLAVNMQRFHDDSELDPNALREISRLQEDILETLRNELKKLKEPEVIGASNVSTPTYEIGQDMTPLPSVNGSAVHLLQPVRMFSPISPRKKLSKKFNSVVGVGKKITSSSTRTSTKYDYKRRNYPRPWADAPKRKKTISSESLEVHVTSSHFSDISVLSAMAAEVTPHTVDSASFKRTSTDLECPVTSVPMDLQSSNALDKVPSVELWKKSVVIINKDEDTSRVMKSSVKSKVAFSRDLNTYVQYHATSKTEVNYMFHNSNSRLIMGKLPAVLLPDPLLDSEGLKDALWNYNGKKYALSLDLGCSMDCNNNGDEHSLNKTIDVNSGDPGISDITDPSAIFERIFCKLNQSKKIQVQVTSKLDQDIQTDEFLMSSSSKFELGLFVATLLDELVDTACNESLPDAQKSSICQKNVREEPDARKMIQHSKPHKHLSHRHMNHKTHTNRKKENVRQRHNEKNKSKESSVAGYIKTHGSLKVENSGKQVAAKSSRVLEDVNDFEGPTKRLHLRGTKSTSNPDKVQTLKKKISTRRLLKKLAKKLKSKGNGNGAAEMSAVQSTTSKKSSGLSYLSSVGVGSSSATSPTEDSGVLKSTLPIQGTTTESAKAQNEAQRDGKVSLNAISQDQSTSRTQRKKRTKKRKLIRIKGDESDFSVCNDSFIPISGLGWINSGASPHGLRCSKFHNVSFSVVQGIEGTKIKESSNNPQQIGHQYFNFSALMPRINNAENGTVPGPRLQYSKLFSQTESAGSDLFQFVPTVNFPNMNFKDHNQQKFIKTTPQAYWNNPNINSNCFSNLPNYYQK